MARTSHVQLHRTEPEPPATEQNIAWFDAGPSFPLSRRERGTGGEDKAKGDALTLKRLIPPPRQPDRRADKADHAVGLHEVAPLLPGPRIDVLGEQAVTVAAGEHVLEQRPGLVAASDGGKSVDVPEGADQKRVLRRSE